MKLFYRQYGDTNNPAIIILHGLFGASDNWVSISKFLSEKYCVYLIDQRNHGQSPHSPDWNYTLMADDLFEFIQTEYIENPIILGHSMGGKTAMFFAGQFPKKLHKLIVVDIAPRAYPVHHAEILKGLLSLNLSQIKSRKEADTQLSTYIPEIGIRQFLLKNIYRKEDKSFAWRLNLNLINEKIENVGEALTGDFQIDVPTLFIKGANSKYIQDKDSPQIQEQFTNFQLETIENAGHWVHAEQPKVFLEVLNEWLDS